MIRSLARRDEQDRCCVVDVGGVPDARLVDRVLTGSELGSDLVSIDLLNERDGAICADDHLCTFGMYLPRCPGLLEGVHGYEATFCTIAAVTMSASFVPLYLAGKLRLDDRGGTGAEVNRMCRELVGGHGRALSVLADRSGRIRARLQHDVGGPAIHRGSGTGPMNAAYGAAANSGE